MSNSAAARRKEQADIIKKLQDERKALSAQKRRQTSGTGPVSYGVVSTNIAGFGGFNPNINIDTGKLDVGGGVMMGPIAYNPQQKTISSGTLTISGLLNQSSSWIICLGEGAAADDLVTITGASFSGQILYLQAQNNDITIKHNTGNIFTHDGNDVVLSGYNSGTNTGGEVAILIFDNQVVDTSSGKWVVVATHGGTAASSWVGTATSDLNMSNYDIIGIANLDLDGVSATIEGVVNLQFYHTSNSINSIGGDMYYQTNTSQQHQFLVAATPKLRITSAAIEADVGIDMNDNSLVQVQRIEFSNNSTDDITSTVDGIEYDVNSTDEHHFLVGGVEKLTVDSTEITLADDLNLSTNNILNSGVINFSVSGQNITPSSTELLYQVPTGDTHGFYVASTKVCEVNATYFEMQLNRFIDFGANITLSANSGFQTLPSNPVGFIKIRVNGGDARVPYYAV